MTLPNPIQTFIVIIMLLSASGVAQAGTGQDLLESFLQKTQTFQARFSQKLIDPENVVMQQSQGLFSLQRPRKFHWQYDKPSAQEIISDGTYIWLHDSDLEQVTVRRVASALENTPMILLDREARLEEDFKINELGERNGQYWLELSPRSEQSDFKKITVGVDREGLRTMQLINGFDQTTEIEFSQLKINPRIPPAHFEFKPAPGTDVIGEY